MAEQELESQGRARRSVGQSLREKGQELQAVGGGARAGPSAAESARATLAGQAVHVSFQERLREGHREAHWAGCWCRVGVSHGHLGGQLWVEGEAVSSWEQTEDVTWKARCLENSPEYNRLGKKLRL